MIQSLSYPLIQFCFALRDSVTSHNRYEYSKHGKFHSIYEKTWDSDIKLLYVIAQECLVFFTLLQQ